jgi:hypothetical protein
MPNPIFANHGVVESEQCQKQNGVAIGGGCRSGARIRTLEIFEGDGTPRSGEMQVTEVAATSESSGSVVVGTGGNMLVIWADSVQGLFAREEVRGSRRWPGWSG